MKIEIDGETTARCAKHPQIELSASYRLDQNTLHVEPCNLCYAETRQEALREAQKTVVAMGMVGP